MGDTTATRQEPSAARGTPARPPPPTVTVWQDMAQKSLDGAGSLTTVSVALRNEILMEFPPKNLLIGGNGGRGAAPGRKPLHFKSRKYLDVMIVIIASLQLSTYSTYVTALPLKNYYRRLMSPLIY